MHWYFIPNRVFKSGFPHRIGNKPKRGNGNDLRKSTRLANGCSIRVNWKRPFLNGRMVSIYVADPWLAREMAKPAHEREYKRRDPLLWFKAPNVYADAVVPDCRDRLT